MTKVLSWDGDGLSPGPVVQAVTAGTGDTAPTILQGSGQNVEAIGPFSPAITLEQAAATQCTCYWNHTSLSAGFFRAYLTPLASPILSTHVLFRMGNGATRGFDLVATSSNRLSLFNSANVLSQSTGVTELLLPTRYRMEVAFTTTTVDLKLFYGENRDFAHRLQGSGGAGEFGTAFTRFIIGNASTSPTTEKIAWDSIWLDDAAMPAPKGSPHNTDNHHLAAA